MFFDEMSILWWKLYLSVYVLILVACPNRACVQEMCVLEGGRKPRSKEKHRKAPLADSSISTQVQVFSS